MKRYQTIPVRSNSTIKPGVRFYTTTLYPEIGLSPDDIYVITSEGDRLDLLANQFYEDATLYWIISTANNHLSKNSLNVPPGTQVRIPTNTGEIIAAFEELNEL